MIFQGSLGYYINPLMYVIVGVLIFGERLRRLQSAAVLLAAAGDASALEVEVEHASYNFV